MSNGENTSKDWKNKRALSMIRSIKGDCLESIFFNLQMAIQKCIDIAAHIIREESYGVPGSTGKIFFLLGE